MVHMNNPAPHPLKQKIKAAGLRQLDLVRTTGIKQSRLSLFLNGWYPMPEDVQKKLEKALANKS